MKRELPLKFSVLVEEAGGAAKNPRPLAVPSPWLSISALDSVVSQLRTCRWYIVSLRSCQFRTQSPSKESRVKSEQHGEDCHSLPLGASADCVLSHIWLSSEDDPFLLYATLHSGNHCKFITKDLMRDHKACLPDAKTQRLFFKWQQGHQLAIISRHPGSRITFQVCYLFST